MAIMDRVRRGEFDLSGIFEPLAGLLRECLAPEPLERPTVHEIREQLRGLQQDAHVVATAAESQPEPELWTMPFSPAASPVGDPAPATDRLPAEGLAEEPSAHVVTPLQVPSPPSQPVTAPVPTTRALPAESAPPLRERPDLPRPEQGPIEDRPA